MSVAELKLRDLRSRYAFANALRAACSGASDTRSQALIERSVAP